MGDTASPPCGGQALRLRPGQAGGDAALRNNECENQELRKVVGTRARDSGTGAYETEDLRVWRG